jgi:hypothetical protein
MFASSADGTTAKGKACLHMYNSPIRKSLAISEKVASLRFPLAPHLLDSRDLAPSDFFLFGHFKEKMIGIDFESPRELINWIQSTFEAIPTLLLDKDFESWLRRVRDYINIKGSYIKV